MRVRIVSYEDVNAWILGKFARKLKEELMQLGVHAEISNKPDTSAHINHHIIYLDYNERKPSPVDTLMITHLDSRAKLELISKQLLVAKAGICMSLETMNLLIRYGIDPSKVCYITPAHDGVIKKRKICIGITSKVHSDGRKREHFLVKLADKICPDNFRFIIMGIGWEGIVKQLIRRGFEIEYYNRFNYERYIQIIPSLDYYLYMGLDEGSMGFIDALAAGVKTIVTPQGYHLDALNGITHAFTTFEELVKVFDTIAGERKILTEAVRDWSWSHYAQKHLDIWNYFLHKDAVIRSYEDGLNSLINKNFRQTGFWNKVAVQHKILRLTCSRFLHAKNKVGKIRKKIKV